MDSASLLSPYKFLDSYGPGDRDLFFGRERETRIFLSDIVVARLVVLFAKTGTGKTSLINAGVRPLLEQREYATFLVRVAEDPLESARAELRRHAPINALTEASFPSEVAGLARALERSIVIFFDQFEEFFLQTVPGDPEGAQRFISNVADLYEDEHSRVHVVFSMREEFFVEMDAFRDEIPTIFHNDSNLRLRWFDLGQARDAITKPAEVRGVQIEDELVDHVLNDLSRNGSIEPAQLQILCDTLWRSWSEERAGSRLAGPLRISEQDYLKLGPDTGPNVARQVLSRRLEQEFERLETQEQLELLERLLPLLRTERNTKYPRDTESLVELLSVSPGTLEDVLRWLEEAHLVRRNRFESAVFVELSHDYLAEQLPTVQAHIGGIWPRRLLGLALETGSLLDREAVELVLRRDPPLELDAREAELVFRSSLMTTADIVRAFEFAREAGVDVRPILQQALEGTNTDAALAAVQALGTPESDEWLNLVEGALKRPILASAAVDALVGIGTEAAVGVLAQALEDQGLVEYARLALQSVVSLHGNDRAGGAARQALEEHERKRGTTPLVEDRPTEDVRDRGWASAAEEERHFSLVADLLLSGEVIPFLGAGVNEYDRPTEASWASGAYLPSAKELALMLAERSRYPDTPDPDLMRVSQYIEVVLGEGQLYRYLHAVFAADYPPGPLHRLLGRLPGALRDRGLRQLVLLTTNFDDLVERTFEEMGEPFDVVWYEAKRGPLQGSFLHQSPDGAVVAIDRPNKYAGLAAVRPVIVKLLGRVDRSDPKRDSFVVTEDAFIDYVASGDVGERIPVALRARMADSHFLILGHSISDWSARAILNRLWGAHGLDLKSWAVQPQVSDARDPLLEEAFWRERGDIDLVGVGLREYIAGLKTVLGARMP
jgi:hypothetical protein